MPFWLSLVSTIAISESFYTFGFLHTGQLLGVLLMCVSIFRWRDFGLLWVFVIFNAVAAVAIYYVARVVRHFVPSMRSSSLFANSSRLSHSLRTPEKSKRPSLSKGRRVKASETPEKRSGRSESS